MCGENCVQWAKTPEVKIGAASQPILMCGAVTGKGKRGRLDFTAQKLTK
jgi:hypothetical protein